MKYRLAVLVLALSYPPCAAFDAAPAQGRLARAGEASAAAATSSSLEQSSALSLRALEDGPVSGAAAVDARGTGQKDASTPNLVFSPKAASKINVPAPIKAASRGEENDHAGLFILGGLAAPAVGAIAGALIGGGPGAIAGALLGLCAGLVLFAIGVCRALRHVFNP